MTSTMSKKRKQVAIGLIGSTLDAGLGKKRHDKWRPSVALCQQEGLVLDRFELLHQPRFEALAQQVAADIEAVSPATDVHLHPIEIDDAWDFEEVYAALFDFARREALDPEAEDYLVHITTGTHVAQICLFLLTQARHLPARLVQTSPKGRDPAGTHTIIDLDLGRYDALAKRFDVEKSEGRELLRAGIQTQNPAFNELIARIELVAGKAKDPILLEGPTGAGKSFLASRLYELKKKRQGLRGAFVEVNCATLRGDLAPSALFGHVRGAFTGAEGKREGLLRRADGGVLFLDEIGELGLDEQAMLLRAVEEKLFLPVGSDREVKSDFQLFAGTNRELRERVSQGLFREDLLARIDTWTFRLPGLAERREDIAPNLEYQLERVGARLGARVSISVEARARFLAYAQSDEAKWRGNFRDLDAAVTRMATLAEGGRIDTRDVDAEIARLRQASRGRADVVDAQPLTQAALGAEANQLDRFDRVQLEDVLRVCRESASLSDAGRTLFSESRKKKAKSNDADRLRKYLARFGLDWASLAERGPVPSPRGRSKAP